MLFVQNYTYNAIFQILFVYAINGVCVPEKNHRGGFKHEIFFKKNHEKFSLKIVIEIATLPLF